jgi:hypothetical protein
MYADEMHTWGQMKIGQEKGQTQTTERRQVDPLVMAQPKVFNISLRVAKKAMLFIDISLSRKDFLWTVKDDDYEYKHLFQCGFVKGENHKYGFQVILLNIMVSFAVAP